MPAAVETMAWTNEVPWHGLGVQVKSDLTTDAMMKAAGLNWSVSKRAMWAAKSSEGDEPAVKVPDAYALCRDSDNKVMDVVGNAYTPVQNAQAFEFFREFVEAGKAHIETAGSLKGGRMIWVLANLGKSFKLAGKDEVKSYLLLCNPHIQGKSMVGKFTSVRVVCNNTLTAALAEEATDQFRRAHRSEFDGNAQEMAKVTLGIAREQSEEFAEIALKLSKFKVDELQAARILAEVFDKGSELKLAESLEVIRDEANKATSVAMAALVNAPGAQLVSAKGTAWGVLNAVTYTTDHVLRKSADSRVYNAWFGKSGNMKQDALDLLVKLAG